jgi:hypothetical protein
LEYAGPTVRAVSKIAGAAKAAPLRIAYLATPVTLIL